MAAQTRQKHKEWYCCSLNLDRYLVYTWIILSGPVGTLDEVLHRGNRDCRGASAEDRDKVTHTSELRH